MSNPAIIGDAVITTDIEGRITSLNPVAESLTGWTQAEAVSLSLETVFKIVDPETRKTVESPTVQALQDGVNVGLTNHTLLIAKDGRELPIGPIDHSATPIRNDLGELTGAVLVFRDITHLYIQERRIRAALAYADNIIETLREPFLVLDNSFRVKSANQAFYKAFQVVKDQTEGRLIYELGNGQWDTNQLRKLMDQVLLDQDSVHDFAVEADFPTIGKKNMLLNARRFGSVEGQPDLILLAIEDITERSLAEAKLRESEENYRRVVELMPAGVYTVDAAGVITFYNQQAAAMWGRQPELGDTDKRFCGSTRLFRHDGTPMPHDQTLITAALLDGSKYRDLEAIIERPDASRIHVRVNIAPICDTDGKIIGAINVFDDISQRNLMEQALHDSEIRYRRLFETAKDGILLLNTESGRITDANPFMCELLGYQQTQAIRLYYEFYNVDVDRYHLSDGYHQVMLSTRELSEKLPAKAQTWVNRNLQFTHGEGVVMNFVSKITPGGFPEYIVDNIPPQSSHGLKITEPAIYYGESMPGNRIVATGVKEFDYPKGNQNVYTSYEGHGGIPLDSFGKRLLFAWTQADINILLTSYLKPESRIQIWRDVRVRAAQVAPFLRFDADPYAVVSEGKLYWIQDAYTLSNSFPYSNPHGAAFENRLNYIRNSVKVIVDMYDGAVSLYVMDPDDPVLAAYQHAFPGVFKELKELSADLKLHLRYPQDLFAVQAAQYESFHMTDPQVFYNREDLWESPHEKYDGKVSPMEPYYILMKLPDSDQLEYLLMSPFTPQNRDNMIAWMAARCDFPDYGKMMFYQLPKEKLIFGPNQVGAMIDQNTTISQQLTLWDQKGSGVIRGKLVVILIEKSFLYVVPLYLRAEGANFPQLKRVIAATGNKVVMEPTLDGALSALFGSPSVPKTGAEGAISNSELDQARVQLAEVQKAIDSLSHLLNEPTAITPVSAALPK